MGAASRLLLSATLGLALLPAWAGEKTYAEEYQNRIKSASNVEAHGETPFGESTDLYTGSTTFSQTDLVLEGKGPPIRITRSSTDFDESAENPFQFSGFGDWQLEVPMIETIAPGTLKYNATVGEWKVVGPSGATTDRCTYFGEMWTPPDGYYGGQSMLAPAYSWWSGYTLKIPGAGSQPILTRLPATPTPATGTYPGVTTQHYQLGCQAGLGTTNGQPGQGFVVLAPDGTKYFMTHLSYAMYSTYRETEPTDYRIIFRVGRVIARMKASRVEDRFGNYITYSYTGDKLTAITGSDGRSVSIAWWSDAPLIQSISANGRTWSYAYASRSATGGTLSQVTLPDLTSWIFTGTVSGSGTGPVFISGCLPGNVYPIPASSTGITSTYVVKHPSGVTGTFRYSGRLRAQSHMGTTCIQDPWGGYPYEANNPYFYVGALVERELSGPGMSNALWTYSYEVAHPSVLAYCPGTTCQGTTYTDVTDPGGERTRYIHSTRWGPLQGKLLRSEVYNAASQLQRAEDKTYNYADSDLPYPSTFGNALHFSNSPYASENLVVLRKSVITQQGRTFTWEVPSGCAGGLTGYCFDLYGRPTKTIKSSAP